MEIRFACDGCGQHMAAEENLRGQRVTCPDCRQTSTVPRQSTLPDVPAKSISRDIVFDCNACGQNLVVDARAADSVVGCPKCKKPLRVPPSPSVSKRAVENTKQPIYAPAPETKKGSPPPPPSAPTPPLFERVLNAQVEMRYGALRAIANCCKGIAFIIDTCII